MNKRFVFVRDVEAWLAEGKQEWALPEDARLTDAAADLVKERGIRIRRTKRAAVESPAAWGAGRETSEVAAAQPTSPAPAKGLIAVAAAGPNPSDPVGSVATRSPYFLLFEAGGTFLGALENPHADTGGGAGRLAADFVEAQGVQTLVAGNFGRNITADLENKGIRTVKASGSGEEAVKAL